MVEANLLKGLRKSNIVNKIIQINHEEVDFRELEVMMLAILSAMKKVIRHLNAQIITYKRQIKESILD